MAKSINFGFLLVFCIMLILVVKGSSDDISALASFRSGLSDSQNVLDSWDTNLVDPCTWFHISCDDDNRVVRIDLMRTGLSGHLDPQLGKLDRLQYLSLGENNLQGSIPQELGNLVNLKSLDLYENQFSGTIPPSLGNLQNLAFFRLNNNQLTGPIPIELGGIQTLVVVDVSNNDLCGPVPMDGSLLNIQSYNYDNNTRINNPC